MLIDLASTFSGATAADGTKTAQAITATALSTNVLDTLGQATPALVDNGAGSRVAFLVVQVIQAFNTLTSLTITLESDSTSNMATAPVVHFSKTVALAALTANTFVVKVALPSDSYKRYLAVRYTVVGSNPTLGSVLAYIALDVPSSINAYPTGFTIDV